MHAPHQQRLGCYTAHLAAAGPGAGLRRQARPPRSLRFRLDRHLHIGAASLGHEQAARAGTDEQRIKLLALAGNAASEGPAGRPGAA